MVVFSGAEAVVLGEGVVVGGVPPRCGRLIPSGDILGEGFVGVEEINRPPAIATGLAWGLALAVKHGGCSRSTVVLGQLHQ